MRLFFLFLLSAVLGADCAGMFTLKAQAPDLRAIMVSSYSKNAVQEKEHRTAAQQKIDSQLLFAIYRRRGVAKAKNVPPGALAVKFDEKGRAVVSIRAHVTKPLLAKIKSLGGYIVSSSPEYNDIRAHMPLENLEKLAARKDIIAIMPAEEAMTNRPN